MFTGLVEATAEVISRSPGEAGERLVLATPKGLRSQVKYGDSVAVNGLCLSAAETGDDRLGFDVIPESLRRSNLGALQAGDLVNVETALRAGDPLGGHMVSGHIDCTAEVVAAKLGEGDEKVLCLRLDEPWQRFLFAKGSIALNGTSLTLAEVAGDSFSVCLIPVTLQETNLGQVAVGDLLNTEIDQTARYIAETAERLWQKRQSDSHNQNTINH